MLPHLPDACRLGGSTLSPPQLLHDVPAGRYQVWSVTEDAERKASELSHAAAKEYQKASATAQAKAGNIELYSGKYCEYAWNCAKASNLGTNLALQTRYVLSPVRNIHSTLSHCDSRGYKNALE